MTNPDYPAFRRYIDALVDDTPRHPAVVERAEGPNLYVLSEELYSEIMAKAQAYDAAHPAPRSEEEKEEIAYLKGLLEGSSSPRS